MRPIDALKMRNAAPAGPTGYRYYRLHMTAICTPSSELALIELELYETGGGTNFATSATATASADAFGWTPDHINDGITDGASTGWHAPSNAVPQWVQLDLGSGNSKGLHSYKIWCRGGREDQAPAAWTMEGSNDAAAWTTLDTESGWTAVAWGTPSRSPLTSWQLFTI